MGVVGIGQRDSTSGVARRRGWLILALAAVAAGVLGAPPATASSIRVYDHCTDSSSSVSSSSVCRLAVAGDGSLFLSLSGHFVGNEFDPNINPYFYGVWSFDYGWTFKVEPTQAGGSPPPSVPGTLEWRAEASVGANATFSLNSGPCGGTSASLNAYREGALPCVLSIGSPFSVSKSVSVSYWATPSQRSWSGQIVADPFIRVDPSYTVFALNPEATGPEWLPLSSEANEAVWNDLTGRAAPVPEPGTLALFVSGAVSLGLLRRRR